MDRHRYLTLAQVADQYGVSVKTLRRRIADRTLPAVKVGGQVRVREADTERLVEPIPVGNR